MNYAQYSNRALELLIYYGSEVTFILKGTEGGFDDDGNPIPAQPSTMTTGTATPIVEFTTSDVDGKSILSGDGYCFFQGAGDIAVGAQLTINGITHRVINNYSLSSNDGINLFQKLQLRS